MKIEGRLKLTWRGPQPRVSCWRAAAGRGGWAGWSARRRDSGRGTWGSGAGPRPRPPPSWPPPAPRPPPWTPARPAAGPRARGGTGSPQPRTLKHALLQCSVILSIILVNEGCYRMSRYVLYFCFYVNVNGQIFINKQVVLYRGASSPVPSLRSPASSHHSRSPAAITHTRSRWSSQRYKEK